MDNVTHSLVGAALAETGLKRITPLGSATLIVAANIPDVDVISLAFGPFAYLKWHRGITHSLIGFPIVALLLALCMYAAARIAYRRGKLPSPAGFAPLLLLSFVGTVTHPLLDFTNSYGWRPFLPFNDEWHYIDLTFVADPWIWLALGATVFLARAKSRRAIVLWISGAVIAGSVIVLSGVAPVIKIIWITAACVIGALRFFKVEEKAARELNIAGVSALILYIVVLAILHVTALFRAAEAAQVAVAPSKQVVEINALPSEANPLKWRAFVSTEDGYQVADVNLLGPGNDASTTFQALPRLDGPQSALDAAGTHPDVRTFLRFARYPVTRVTPRAGGQTVEIEDIRFGLNTNAFRIKVDLDETLKPVRVYR